MVNKIWSAINEEYKECTCSGVSVLEENCLMVCFLRTEHCEFDTVALKKVDDPLRGGNTFIRNRTERHWLHVYCRISRGY